MEKVDEPQEHSFVDTHCNVPNVLDALSISLENLTWSSLTTHFASQSKGHQAKLTGILSVSSDRASTQATLNLLSCDNVYGAFGIHPLYAYEYEEGEVEKVEAMEHPKAVAYGEIGLDYHKWPASYNYAQPDLQKKIFISQIKHALELQKPIIIHTREAEEDTMSIMKEYIPKDWKIHVHCFTDSLEFSQRLIAEWPNLWIGFAGVVTFKNSKALQKVAAELPLDRLLLETDAPFLTPEPYRGKTCHPGHTPLIAAKIAQLKGIDVGDVYKACRENTTKMYGF
eukprot:TRINITY_DN3689_c0_g1_i2.p1 TRINITY_DN3689_c0_g1~~TRINITY_DN3689_c0_g1_i2.p1  ORF type:complete len:283 (-),score=49.95 TRINITY_DN3689_c0_g1_i2:27-875(-)